MDQREKVREMRGGEQGRVGEAFFLALLSPRGKFGSLSSMMQCRVITCWNSASSANLLRSSASAAIGCRSQDARVAGSTLTWGFDATLKQNVACLCLRSSACGSSESLTLCRLPSLLVGLVAMWGSGTWQLHVSCSQRVLLN